MPSARLRQLLRATPVRQALGLTALFAVINMTALGGTYLKMRQDSLRALESQLTRHMEELEVSATPRAMAAIVAAKAEAADPAETVIAFLGRDGSRSGNARVKRHGGGADLFPLDGRPLAKEYIQEVRQFDSGLVILGASLAPLEDLRRTFSELLLLTLGPTVLLSLLLGSWSARRNAHRLAAIETMLAQLSRGELGSRLPERPADLETMDDLDRVAFRLNRMAARLQDTVGALQQVSADIAHDLRTPLQRMSAHLETLRQQMPTPDVPPAALDALEQEITRASAIFSGLLQIARIEGGLSADDLQPVDLCEVARQVHELYLPVAEDQQADLRLRTPVSPCLQSGQRDLLMQAMINLVENALRHAGSQAEIEIAVTPDGFEISDTGPGIPEADRKSVTRRLYRLERSRSTPGNGLGLALVEAIASAHGGTFTLKNNPKADNSTANHAGLCARVLLPKSGS
ncbi:sensor histidine kinase [Tritonibacter multivorans]|uniref:sensor histidine kinase n=1 Tax=Tritonibacter multivorans TaxID=928856 RepID=UPI00071DE21D|nr:HAMP domain-containing sensor histidine kinase [Tritonibacter multivorans]